MNELILYVHDDGETTKDSMTFALFDGDFSETKTVNVVIGLVGDETPRVTVNKGLRVQKGTIVSFFLIVTKPARKKMNDIIGLK